MIFHPRRVCEKFGIDRVTVAYKEKSRAKKDVTDWQTVEVYIGTCDLMVTTRHTL